MVRRRAAVLGRPVEHSLSPVLHGAAYRALGLDWSYDRVDCGDAELAGVVAGFDESWVGLSVTMPGKVAALAVAATATDRARAVGAANTLVRVEAGWHADCTDIDGVTGALRAAGIDRLGSVAVLGAGGTARAALAGVADLGARTVRLVVRSADRARGTVDCARELGLSVETAVWTPEVIAELCADVDLAVCTVPATASGPDDVATAVAAAPVVLDVGYHPWPTPVGAAVTAAGGRLVTGLDMLLHQAFGQVEAFTGTAAPRAAMADALRAAVPAYRG